MMHKWAPTISITSLKQLVMIRVVQWKHGSFILGLAWDPRIIGLDISTTIMGELIFTREDYSDLPLDFRLEESVSLLIA